MRKISKKFALPAAAAGAVLTGGLSSAMAGFTVTVTQGATANGYTQYTASIVNTGGGTGTTIVGSDTTVTMNTPGAYILVDNSTDLDGDGTKDFNISGTQSNIFAASSAGTFMNLPGATSGKFFTSDSENGVVDSTSSWSSYSASASGPNPGFNPSLYQHLTSLDLTWTTSTPTGVGDTVAKGFFNIVVPAGAGFTVSGQAGGGVGTAVAYTPVVIPPAGGGGTFPIVVLTASAPTNTGSAITPGNGAGQGTFVPAGTTLTVTGGGGSYTPGFIYSLSAGTGIAAGYVKTSGFTGTDTNVYLLNIKVAGSDPTLAQENTIIADINNGSAGNTGVVASLVPANLTGLGGVVSAWDIELAMANPANQNGYFGFNFTGETNVSGVTVTDIAAVPEPATAGLLLVGGLGLLARRRRSAN